MCRIEGTCASFRAKTVEISGHLPTTSHQIMVVLRSHRSTSAPAGRLKSRYGNWRAAASRPARASECVSASISKGRASAEMLVPNVEIVCPLQITQKLPLRQRAGRARLICGCSKDTFMRSISGMLLPNNAFYQKKSRVERSGGGPRAYQKARQKDDARESICQDERHPGQNQKMLPYTDEIHRCSFCMRQVASKRFFSTLAYESLKC
jgi:hypothetical protein